MGVPETFPARTLLRDPGGEVWRVMSHARPCGPVEVMCSEGIPVFKDWSEVSRWSFVDPPKTGDMYLEDGKILRVVRVRYFPRGELAFVDCADAAKRGNVPVINLVNLERVEPQLLCPDDCDCCWDD